MLREHAFHLHQLVECLADLGDVDGAVLRHVVYLVEHLFEVDVADIVGMCPVELPALLVVGFDQLGPPCLGELCGEQPGAVYSNNGFPSTTAAVTDAPTPPIIGTS